MDSTKIASKVEELEKNDKIGAFLEKALSATAGFATGSITAALTGGEPYSAILVASTTTAFVHHELERTVIRNQISKAVYSKE